MEKIENYQIEYFYNGKAIDIKLITEGIEDLKKNINDSFNRGQLSGEYISNVKSEGNTHLMDIISFQITKKK